MSDLTDELLRLLGEGRTIEAIRRYREATGVGLAEAKQAVDDLLVSLQTTPAGAAPTDDLTKEIVDTARTAGLIAAIKRYREATGVGLKEAKDAVEAICGTHGVVPAAGKAGGAALLIALGIVFAAAGIVAAALVFKN